MSFTEEEVKAELERRRQRELARDAGRAWDRRGLMTERCRHCHNLFNPALGTVGEFSLCPACDG